MFFKKSFFYIIFGASIFLSCKTKKIATQTSDPKIVKNNSTAAKTIEQFYLSKPNFKTIYIKADVDYKDNRQAQSVTADIKIEKDKNILLSVRFLGFTVAKALITPDKVQYYEKLGGKFFEGNYSTISQWLGTDLDFQKIQNMIIGQPFENLTKTKYEQKIVDQVIQLEPKTQIDVQSQYLFSQNPLLLVKQLFGQAENNRAINIDYRNHEQFLEGTMPKNIDILATQNAKNTSIKIELTKISFNEALTFSYSVPDGYEKMEIKQ